SRDPCHLHSFPTRRSSDLPRQHFPVKLQQILIIIKEEDFMAGGHIWFNRTSASIQPVQAVNCKQLTIISTKPRGHVKFDKNLERTEEHTTELQSRFKLLCR